MTERPILFSAPMVKAILAGTKTQTRRIIKLPHNNPLGVWEATTFGGPGCYTKDGKPYSERPAIWHTRTGTTIVPPYEPGDTLWVREAWRSVPSYDDLSPAAMGGEEPVQYMADMSIQTWGWPGRFVPGRSRPSIHMPRWASRITLKVTAVRVERLQDITGMDAAAEGIPLDFPGGHHGAYYRAVGQFRTLWTSINGAASWEANPWVAAISFERIKP